MINWTEPKFSWSKLDC